MSRNNIIRISMDYGTFTRIAYGLICDELQADALQELREIFADKLERMEKAELWRMARQQNSVGEKPTEIISESTTENTERRTENG